MFKRGDRIEILPEFRDPGDELLTWVVCGDEEKGRVDVTPIDTGLSFPPVYTVRATQIRAAGDEPEAALDDFSPSI
jgi:hypothetical protein